MISGRIVNFQKKTFDTTVTKFDYDYDSIMHYGPYSFRYIFSTEFYMHKRNLYENMQLCHNQ